MGSALALKNDYLEEADMASAEPHDLAIQVAELRSDVRHLQSDVSDIKVEIREIKADIRDIHKKFEKIDEKFEKFDEKFSKKFEELKDSIASAKLWALGMYITQAGGMLYIIAKGAKWF